ncbi:MAG: serine hydrolase [Leptolyngbya sp. SIO1E4]|nr:serine hydrolase [Leptolyngbya sp. SIO1E4]
MPRPLMTLSFVLGAIPAISMLPIPSSAIAQMQISPQAALERLFTTPQLQAEWFAPAMLNQFPLSQAQQLIAEMQADFGAYQEVQPSGELYLVLFERGRVAAQITLNSRGQIAGLFFQPAPMAISLDEAIEQLQAFPGEVNFLVLEDQSELAALNADNPLAVGSTFKLAVLAALRQQIESDQRSWGDVVELRPEWKSLPSGFLHTWPDGTQLTLETLATLMISMSDNTATDALIHVLGRASIEAYTLRNRPFLTTREFFILKAPQNISVLERYRSLSSLQGRQQILDEIASYPLPDVGAASSTHEGQSQEQLTASEIGYFFTPHELCALMAQVADLPLMGVNPAPGVVNAEDWARVAFKGGSIPGVLNLTHQLEAESGKTYCVSMTWNHSEAPLDEMRLSTLYGAVIKGLSNNP